MEYVDDKQVFRAPSSQGNFLHMRKFNLIINMHGKHLGLYVYVLVIIMHRTASNSDAISTYLLKYWLYYFLPADTFFSRTPDWDFRCFNPCEIISISHIPIPARGKDKNEQQAGCPSLYC